MLAVASAILMVSASSQDAPKRPVYTIPTAESPLGSDLPFAAAATLAHLQTAQMAATAGYSINSKAGIPFMDPRVAGSQSVSSTTTQTAPTLTQPATIQQTQTTTAAADQYPTVYGFRSKRKDGTGVISDAPSGGMRFASSRQGLGAEAGAKVGTATAATARSASLADAALKNAERVLHQAQKVSLLHPQTGEAKAVSNWHSAYRPAQMRLMGPQAIESWKEEHARFASDRRNGVSGKGADGADADASISSGRSTHHQSSSRSKSSRHAAGGQPLQP